jgi:tetratricopeptide (TPR) repeat protein
VEEYIVMKTRTLFLLVALFMAAPVLAASSGDLPEADQARLDAAADDQARLTIMEQLAAERPNEAPVQFHLGNTLYDLGQIDGAIAAYRKAVSIDDQLLGAYVNLGSALDESGKLEDALAAYETALTIDDSDARLLCNIGGVYFQKRRIDRALENFQRALEADPQSQLAHYNLAILFADAEIYREAIAEWEAAVAIDANSDIGRRSADNIIIIREMMAAEMPEVDGR